MIEQRETKWLTTYLLVDETALAQQLVANERACVQLLLWTFETVLRPYNGAAAIIMLYRRWLDGDEPTSDEWTRAAAVGAADSRKNLRASHPPFSAPDIPAAWAISSPHHFTGALQAAAQTSLCAARGKTEAAMDAAVDAHRAASLAKVRELLAS